MHAATMHHRHLMRDSILSPAARRFLGEARRGVLATTDPRGHPRLVPICHVVGEADDPLGRPRLYTPLDEKPKASPDPHALGRVRDLLVLPAAVVLVDRWDEDWAHLGWLRVYGTAEILEPQPREREEHSAVVALLRAKYAQYRVQRLEERPVIRITISEARSWGALEP
jgi:PPOX class probable F420-dependent enzyme